MSKAFTKEPEGDEDDSDLDPPEPVTTGPQYITAEGFQKLSDELDQLWKVERPRVTREVEAAAAMGDRSENAEYIYGKRRLREIDRRLRYLKKRLERITVVREAPADGSRVFFGCFVTLRDEDGKLVTYRLIGGDEVDLAKRWISIDSPMGKAVLGKRVGDVVTVKRPKGDVDVEIVEVRF